jgi:predicted choloylglycine hydrolase
MVDIHYCGYDDNPDFTSLESRIGLLQSPYMPFDGMNEAGVGISMMAVDDAQPPYDPGKRTLDDLGIIRLILDKAHSTVEAIALMSAHNISMQQVPLHYFIADKSGKSAVVEFVSNEMRVLYNTTNYQASTNFIFSKYKAPYIGLCNRYDYVYATLSDSSGYCSMVGAMTILQKASAGITMWSSVYELSTGQIDVVPGRKYGNTYRFTLRVM